MRMSIFKTSTLLVMMSIFGMLSARGAGWPDDNGDPQKLEGTWVVTVSLQDCSLGTPIGAPFTSLLTFARGGTMTESTSSPMFFPAFRGPGHGIWSKTGGNTYKALSIAMITVNGVLTRTQTITQAIEMQNENSFATTSATVKFFAPNGTVVGTGCAAATGTRLEFEGGF
jgi:hypothetical protein